MYRENTYIKKYLKYKKKYLNLKRKFTDFPDYQIKSSDNVLPVKLSENYNNNNLKLDKNKLLCSLVDIFNDSETKKQLYLLTENKIDENQDILNDNDLKILKLNENEYVDKSNIKVFIKAIILVVGLKFNLGSIIETVKDYILFKKFTDEKETNKKHFDSIEKRIIFVLNNLGEIDLLLELYHRFLVHIKNNYKDNTLLTFLVNKGFEEYNAVLLKLYKDLGFEFKLDEIHDIDLFFHREHLTRLQIVYDYTLNKVFKNKDKEYRMKTYCIDRFVKIIIKLESIKEKMLVHLHSLEFIIFRLELLIDKNKCNYQEVYTYDKPINKLLNRLFICINDKKHLKKNIEEDLKSNKISNIVKRLLNDLLNLL